MSKVKNPYVGRDLLKQIKLAKKLSVAVGLPAGFERGRASGKNAHKAQSRTTDTVLDIGMTHEFGNPRKGIPQRSFLRTTNIVNAKKIDTTIKKQFKKVLDGKESANNAMEKVGIFTVGLVQKAFTNRGYGTWQDISQVTKDKKGSSQVLIDTGILRGSITHAVRKK